MDRKTVYRKTAKGLEEAEKRTYKLEIRSRAALLAVNGTETVDAIIHRFHGLEQLAGLLANLERDGFIEAVTAKPSFEKALRAVVAKVHELLGPDGDAISERLEQLGESAKNAVAVMKFLEQRREMFESIAGKQKAAQFFEQAAKLLR